jgi:hypothetical protein
MTLRKFSKRKRRMCCDQPGCHATFGEPFFPTEIKTAAASAKANGWRIYKTKAGNWQHLCPRHNSGPDDDDGRGGRRPPEPPPAAPAPAGPGRQWWND